MFPENRLLEILIIGAVALIVVGPKDLPILMRRVGQWIGRMRQMAAEFRASFDELARQSELDELRKEVEAMRNDPRHYSNWNPTEQAAPEAAGFTPPEPEPPGAMTDPAAAEPPAAAHQTAPPVPAIEPAPAAAKPAPARKPRAKKTASQMKRAK